MVYNTEQHNVSETTDQQEAALQAAVAYGKAKSQQNIDLAMQYCSQDFVLETPTLGAITRGDRQVRAGLKRWFQMYPDYQFVGEGSAVGEGSVVLWGRAKMTWSGQLIYRPMKFDLEKILRFPRAAVDIPAVAVFDTRGGLLTREVFYFDGLELCAQMRFPYFLFRLGVNQQKKKQAGDASPLTMSP